MKSVELVQVGLFLRSILPNLPNFTILTKAEGNLIFKSVVHGLLNFQSIQMLSFPRSDSVPIAIRIHSVFAIIFYSEILIA